MPILCLDISWLTYYICLVSSNNQVPATNPLRFLSEILCVFFNSRQKKQKLTDKMYIKSAFILLVRKSFSFLINCHIQTLNSCELLIYLACAMFFFDLFEIFWKVFTKNLQLLYTVESIFLSIALFYLWPNLILDYNMWTRFCRSLEPFTSMNHKLLPESVSSRAKPLRENLH